MGWAGNGWVATQSAPYALPTLLEIVAFTWLRESFDQGGPVVWRQLSASFPEAADRRPCELVVDLHTLRAEWVVDDSRLASFLRRAGRGARLLDLTPKLHEAVEGFRLAAGLDP